MFYRIEKSGCCEFKGLVQVRYDLFFDQADEGYSKHYVQVPDLANNTYLGKVDDFGDPADQEDYRKWVDSLNKVWVNTPFCCHFCQFQPDVTDEEILYVGELALDMAVKNFKKGNLLLNKNEPIETTEDSQSVSACVARVGDIIETDFTKVPVESEVPYSVRG